MATVVTSRVQSKASTQTARSPWVWWHLLSLDAPTVAVLWGWFFAQTCGVNLRWGVLPTLALGTWCVYVADRLLDGWRSTATIHLRDRHWFYLKHRKPFLIAWGLAAIPLGYLIFFRVRPSVRTDDIALCLIGIAYFLLIHASPARESIDRLARLFPKELAVGFLFAVASAVPTWAAPATDRSILAAAIFTFGAACWLNCVAIQVWEDKEASQEITHAILAGNSAGRPAPEPHGITGFLGEHLTAFAISVGILGLCLTCTTAKSQLWPLFAAVTLSAVLFLALIWNSRRFSALSLRIAADAALLTPLLFLFRVR